MSFELLLIGGGGHCRSCIDVIEQEGSFAVAGIIERPGAAGEDRLPGYPVLGTDDDLRGLRRKYFQALVTVGQIKSPKPRQRLFEELLALEFELPVIVSPLAYVSPRARIGHGTIIMHQALVNAGAEIGKNCIINSKALVEHGATISDHCHISTGAIINGDSKIGAGTFIGSRAMIRESIEIAPDSFVAAGQNIYESLTAENRAVSI
ncbi:MAG: NeuD/PglB/VioB family sugar acetyltransferase [Desulfosudaceae bacterium]